MSGIAPPSMLLSPGAGPGSLFEQPPPLIVVKPEAAAESARPAIIEVVSPPRSPRSQGPPLHEGTMVSSGASPGALPPSGSLPARVAPPTPSHVAAPPGSLPDSVSGSRSVAQPKLLAGTMFGFDAFRRKAGRGASRGASGTSEPSGAVQGPLGLKGFRSSAPIPVPAARIPSAARPASDSRDSVEPPTARGAHRRRLAPADPGDGAVPAWLYVVGGAIVAIGVATAVVIGLTLRGGGSKPTPGGGPPPTSSGAESRPVATNAVDAGPVASSVDAGPVGFTGFAGLGPETPQLRALLDAQRKLATSCKDDPSTCGRGWTQAAREALNPIDKQNLALLRPEAGPVAAWLRNLRSPSDFPLRDDPALRSMFDYNTKNIAGRKSFQQKLFECSAYSDIFDSTLTTYGAPKWLIAVVYQESGCNHLAQSEVGARGLWQFMPESARAYGLRVVDGEIDERLNPIKSTEAAVHFLTDLERMLGAWDLTLAAYNMGPFAIVAKLAQIGSDGGTGAGFWELAHANLLPDETAAYVPSIEADALILANLTRLQFNPLGKRLEPTAEVVVKPGTRLSLLARAASTTTVRIRDLNPEFLRDVVPEGVNTARVPDPEAHRAQAFIDTLSPVDNRDTCVPPNFDWGQIPFESSPYAANCAATARNAQ